MSAATKPLLEVRNLVKHFPVRGGFFSRVTGQVRAVDGVSFTVERGKTVALVGESGCGKTTAGRVILRLLPPTSGEAYFGGENLFALAPEHLKAMRRRMQIVFQDPYSSLNPRMNVEEIVSEGLVIHGNLTSGQRRDRAAELLRSVGMQPSCMMRYPHEFSGGQRQRIGIARALATKPEFIVCDEAVSALDVSIQAQILNLLRQLQSEMGLAYLFIGHDLSVVRHLADTVVVMYLGQVMEESPAAELFAEPLHPYAKALLSASPVPDPQAKRERIILRGETPSPLNPPAGCRFHTRCPYAEDRCKSGEIATIAVSPTRKVKCVRFAK